MKEKESFWKKRKVLVTGAGGFIGSQLTAEISKLGADVRAVVFDANQHNEIAGIPGIQVFEGDLQDPAFALRATEGRDFLFHLAALKKNMRFHTEHPALILRTNVLLTANILEAARMTGISKTVFVSSVRADDDWLSSGHFGYAWSKKIGELFLEAYAKEYNMSCTSVRIENTFGPGDSFHLETSQIIPALIRRIEFGEDPLVVQGDPKEIRGFSYIDDVIAGILGVAQNTNVVPSCSLPPSYVISLGQLVETIQKASQKKLKVIFPDKESKKLDTDSAFPAAVTALPLEQALEKTIAWFRVQTKNT